MVLSYEQSLLRYQPQKSDHLHLALTNELSKFWTQFPFIRVNTPQFQLNYSMEADLPTAPEHKSKFVSDGGAPPIPFASIPEFAYGNMLQARQAQWAIKLTGRSYLVHPDERHLQQFGNPTSDNVISQLEQFGRDLATNIIRKTVTPAADLVGGINANLNGWNNSTPTINEGYNTALFAQQGGTVFGATLWGFTLAGGTLTTSRTTALDEAIAKIRPYPTGIIMPMVCYIRYKQSFIDRGMAVPMVLLDSALLPPDARFPQGTPVPSYADIPIIAVPDAIYTAAGYTVTAAPGANDYDVFVVRAASPGTDPFTGCFVGYLGEDYRDLPMDISESAPSFPIGSGITAEKAGLITTATGIKNAHGRLLKAEWAFCVGDPQAAAVVRGVKD